MKPKMSKPIDKKIKKYKIILIAIPENKMNDRNNQSFRFEGVIKIEALKGLIPVIKKTYE